MHDARLSRLVRVDSDQSGSDERRDANGETAIDRGR
jgi:hypothetical protein